MAQSAILLIPVRAVFEDAETSVYKCRTVESEKSLKRATAITICNTSNASVKLWLSIVDDREPVNSVLGSLLSSFSIDANETMTLPDRLMLDGDEIRGYAEVAGVISFTTDIEMYDAK